MFRTRVVEGIRTHILCSVAFFHPENRPICEIMYKNTVDPERPLVTIWRMRISRCKATNSILSESNTYCFCAATLVTRTRPVLTLNVHYLSSIARNYYSEV
jgi:hypothetical protein